MSAATLMADEARGAISTNSLCENREELGRGQAQQGESRRVGREGGARGGKITANFCKVSASAAAAKPGASNLTSQAAQKIRSHAAGAAWQEPLAVIPSGPSPWPWASPAGERLPPSTSMLPENGTTRQRPQGENGASPHRQLQQACRHRAGVSQLLTRLFPGSITPARAPTR